MQLFPTKLLGIVADHGSFPVERIAIDQNGEGRWMGSVGHEDSLKMTDLRDVLEDKENATALLEDCDDEDEATSATKIGALSTDNGDLHSDIDQGSEPDDAEEPKEKKRKHRGNKDLASKKRKGRNELDADPSFFAGL